MELVKLLILIIFANGVPVLAHKMMGVVFNDPVDFGYKFIDNRRFFGPSKTIRGVLLAILFTTLISPFFGFEMIFGFLVGFFSMLGDLLTSFIKRRIGLPSSSMALGLDQVLESLFPILACRTLLEMSWQQVWLMVIVFFVSCMILSKILFRLNIRDKPY